MINFYAFYILHLNPLIIHFILDTSIYQATWQTVETWIKIHIGGISSGSALFAKKSSRNIFRVSNSLDPDQARHFVDHDLCPNCLQTAPGTSRQRVNIYFAMCWVHIRSALVRCF